MPRGIHYSDEFKRDAAAQLSTINTGSCIFVGGVHLYSPKL